MRKTRRDRMRAKLKAVKEELRRRMHEPIPKQGAWLQQVVRGFFAYHAVPTNWEALQAFRCHIERIWLRTLRRRSQKHRMTWDRMRKLADDWLPVSPSRTQRCSREQKSPSAYDPFGADLHPGVNGSGCWRSSRPRLSLSHRQ
jgi:hypothetical protein